MEMLRLIKNDLWLKPYQDAIVGRYKYYMKRLSELCGPSQSLSDFASGYLYFGLHHEAKKWVFREWAPNATSIYLVGDFNGWQESKKYQLQPLKNGIWQLEMPENAMKHGDLYKMKVYWDGGCGERIPAWANRVVQDDETKIFSAQVWAPEKPYKFTVKKFKPSVSPLLIYESHVGMAGEAERVSTYREFKDNVLPRIVADGYNCVQIMAIQEHPYYGSFGYHVSSFFAPSSRFGTPDELKELISAHKNIFAKGCMESERCRPESKVCDVGDARLNLDAEGFYYPCDGFHGAILGDARKDSLWDVWTGEALNKLRALKNKDFGSCASCADRAWCKVCPMRNFNETGNMFTHAPWRCEATRLYRRIFEEK